MPNKTEQFWISVFRRSGQRFVCGICGYAGDFNSFRLVHTEEGTGVLFFCPSCNNNLLFDTASRTMRTGGEMIHPEVSLGSKWNWSGLPMAALGVSLVILVLIGALFVRMEARIGRMEQSLAALSARPVQVSGLSGRVDLKDPEAQEIGQGYAILPQSAVSEPGGVRVRGVVVNEKALTVDAEFRFTLGDKAETFTVANLSPGTGEPFSVFLQGATEATGPAQVQVLATNLHLD